jgi:glucose dehydrogenase
MSARARLLFAGFIAAGQAFAQPVDFSPVATNELEDPDAADWLSFSRTPDAQRYSPLRQIDRRNVDRLSLAWSRGLGSGALDWRSDLGI